MYDMRMVKERKSFFPNENPRKKTSIKVELRIEKRVDEKRITSITVKINLKSQIPKDEIHYRKKKDHKTKKKRKKYPGNVNLDRHEKRRKKEIEYG